MNEYQMTRDEAVQSLKDCVEWLQRGFEDGEYLNLEHMPSWFLHIYDHFNLTLRDLGI